MRSWSSDDVQTVEQNTRIGLGRVAAFFANNAFEFAEAHAVVVGQGIVRLGVECVAFLESFPEHGVAHNDGVDDAEVVEGELILAENTHFLRTGDVALGRLVLSSQDLHKSGLAGAVGAGNGVASAFHEGEITSSKRIREPYRIVTSLTAIIRFNFI